MSVGDVAGSPQVTCDVLVEVARIGRATLTVLEQWRREGMRDEAYTAISAVATRLADPERAGATDLRTDAYVLAALLMLNSDSSSGALATDLVELLS